jgi:hypothetical protein
MSFLLYTAVCAGIHQEKNPDWESNKCVGQSEEIRAVGAQVRKKEEKMQVTGFRPQGGASKGSKLAALLVLTRRRARRVCQHKAA